MATFVYKALSLSGERSQGSVVAVTRREALERLQAGGHHVLDLREAQAGRDRQGVSFSLRRRGIRLSNLSRQLATLFASGVPLVQSLNVLIQQTEDPRAKGILADIRESVQGGSTLADALDRHPATFPKVMVGMVRVGEVGGTLDVILTQLAELFEREEALRSEVRGAMAYPTLVLFLGLSSATLLVMFLIPRIASLFEGAGQTLPAPTRLLIWISDVVRAQGWLIALAVLLLIVAGKAGAGVPSVRLFLDGVKLRVPWMGRLIRNASIARFTRLLGTVMQGGISIVDGLDIVGAAIGNRIIARAIGNMAKQIRHGKSTADLMREAGVFPPLAVQMAAVGEETGHLDQMLLRVAEAYERETAASTKTMTSLLAPAMLLAVAAVVGFIILSMMLPIFQLSSVVR